MLQLITFLIGMLLLSLSVGAGTLQAVYEGPLDVIVHARAKAERLTGYELEAVFTRTQTRWDDGTPVIPFSFPAGSEPRVLFDHVALRLGPEEVGRFWLDRRIRGLGLPPKQVPNATLMVQVIANLPGAIGYAPAARTHAGVKVVARIVQGKVVAP
jgi:hypothetical protein